MRLKLFALALTLATGYAVTSSAQEAAPAPKVSVMIDTATGKIQIAPTPEEAVKQEVSEKSPAPAEAPIAEAPAKKAEKPKIIEFGEEQAATEPSESSAAATPGEEQRASYMSVPTEKTIFLKENKCAFVVEDGEHRDCRYDELLIKKHE